MVTMTFDVEDSVADAFRRAVVERHAGRIHGKISAEATLALREHADRILRKGAA